MTDRSERDHAVQLAFASAKLLEIATTIRQLEGLPVDFGLARQLSEVLKRIEESL